MNDKAPIRVGLIDDHRMLLDFMSEALNEYPDFDVVATASTYAEADKWFDAENLDVALIDIQLSDGNGITFGRELRKRNPNISIVLLSEHNRIEIFEGIPAIERVGWSYLTKSSTKSIEVLAHALTQAYQGKSIIDPLLSLRSQAQMGSPVAKLTSRQFQVLRAVARGETNQVVAEKLGLSASSVGNHLIQIYQVLGIEVDENPRVSAVLAFLEATG